MSDPIPNLHRNRVKNKTYWRYRLPDGAYRNLGADRVRAEELAIKANQAREDEESRLSAYRKTLADVINFYEPVKLSRVGSAKSRYEIGRRFKNLKAWAGGVGLAGVSVSDLDALLARFTPSYEPYRVYRLDLIELFKIAIAKGWRAQVDGNPAQALIEPRLSGRVKVPKQTQRLTDAQFWAIHAACPGWLQIGVELMYTYGIRRADLCALRVADVHDGFLFFVPQKTADLPDPAALQLQLTDRADELVKMAKRLPPLCPFLIHRPQSHRGKVATLREHHAQVLPEQFNRAFYKARKVAIENNPDVFAGLSVDDTAKLPGPHEIRSLCARNLEAAGWAREQIRRLLGHADESTTQVYLNEPGVVKWQKVEMV